MFRAGSAFDVIWYYPINDALKSRCVVLQIGRKYGLLMKHTCHRSTVWRCTGAHELRGNESAGSRVTASQSNFVSTSGLFRKKNFFSPNSYSGFIRRSFTCVLRIRHPSTGVLHTWRCLRGRGAFPPRHWHPKLPFSCPCVIRSSVVSVTDCLYTSTAGTDVFLQHIYSNFPLLSNLFNLGLLYTICENSGTSRRPMSMTGFSTMRSPTVKRSK
jgi:hypothetical protein